MYGRSKFQTEEWNPYRNRENADMREMFIGNNNPYPDVSLQALVLQGMCDRFNPTADSLALAEMFGMLDGDYWCGIRWSFKPCHLNAEGFEKQGKLPGKFIGGKRQADRKELDLKPDYHPASASWNLIIPARYKKKGLESTDHDHSSRRTKKTLRALGREKTLWATTTKAATAAIAGKIKESRSVVR